MSSGMSAPLGRTIGPQAGSGYNTGTVVVDVDQASATWTINGPEGFGTAGVMTGTGDTTLTGSDAGYYGITFDAVSGYRTPSGQAYLLADGETITFTGTYSSGVSFEREIVDWLDAALSGSGIAKFNESTQAGKLFDERLPKDDIPAIAIATENWNRHPNRIPGMEQVTISIWSQGDLYADHVTVSNYFERRGGTVSMFSPIALTSYRIESLEWLLSKPTKQGSNPNGDFIYRTSFRSNVKEI